MAAFTLQKTYEAVNRCIYCEDTKAVLTREHIIPYAINGGLVLPKASCPSCQKTINEQIEGKCNGKMFQHVRTHLRMQSGSGLPDELLVTDFSDSRPTGASFPTHPVPVSNHPFTLMLPRFEAPSVLRDGPQATQLTVLGFIMYMKPEFKDRSTAIGPDFGVMQAMPLNEFARYLAKVAHAFLVAECKELFRPTLQSIILGKSTLAPHFVGGPTGKITNPDLGNHSLAIVKHRSFFVVEISLFGAPPYVVIAGEE